MSTSTPEMIEAGMAALSALLEGAADRIEELEAENAKLREPVLRCPCGCLRVIGG